MCSIFVARRPLEPFKTPIPEARQFAIDGPRPTYLSPAYRHVSFCPHVVAGVKVIVKREAGDCLASWFPRSRHETVEV